ncbi:MAG TPA: hypothetical protein VIW70_17010 [Rubrivivax sp.]
MFARKSTLPHNQFADQAARSFSDAAHNGETMLDRAVGRLEDAAHGMEQGLAPVMNRVSGTLSAGADRAAEALRHTPQQLRAAALQAGQYTAGVVKAEPAKSVLVAFAAGAAVMALVSLFSQRRY